MWASRWSRYSRGNPRGGGRRRRRVAIDYEALPAVTDVRAAQAAGAPRLHEAAPGNVCFRWARGDEAAVRAALASAPHKVAVDLVNNRLVGAALEPRAAFATVEPATAGSRW